MMWIMIGSTAHEREVRQAGVKSAHAGWSAEGTAEPENLRISRRL